MNKMAHVQISQAQRSKRYDTLTRFISYFYQIDLSQKLHAENILEVGVGGKTVSNYLRENGRNIHTCDIDIGLKPDCVADIRHLPFKGNSYDLILACEILEHLPWGDVQKVLQELHGVTKKFVIISIPYSAISFELIFLNLHPLGRICKDLFFRIPCFFRKMKAQSQYTGKKPHYWEMGRRNFPKSKIRKLLRERFKIIEEVRPMLNSYHHFFVLEKIPS